MISFHSVALCVFSVVLSVRIFVRSDFDSRKARKVFAKIAKVDRSFSSILLLKRFLQKSFAKNKSDIKLIINEKFKSI